LIAAREGLDDVLAVPLEAKFVHRIGEQLVLGSQDVVRR
jgi:hypothetical protein